MATHFQKTTYVPCCLNDSDSAVVTLFGQSPDEQVERIPALRGICVMSVNSGCAGLQVRLTADKAREIAGLLIAAADSLLSEEVTA